MSTPPSTTRRRTSFAYRCIAVCTALLLALSPGNMIAFAGDGASDTGGETSAPENVETRIAQEEEQNTESDGDDPEAGKQEEAVETPSASPDKTAAAAGIAGSAASAGSDVEVDNLIVSLQWLNVPDAQKQNLSWSDPVNLSNPTQTLTYRLSISSSNVGYATGKLTVRIPQSLWIDRFGTPVNPQSFGIPEAPNTGSAAIPFNYSIDTETNEVVITNTAEVRAASNYVIDAQYSVVPWNTIDGSVAQLVAKATGTAASGTVNQAESNAITYTVDTDVRSDNVLKTDGRPLYFWDSAYTGGKPQPDDFADYRWVTWRVVMGGNANQPYSVTLKDVPGEGGEVYAVTDGDLYYHNLLGSDFTLGADGVITSKVFDDPTVRGPASEPIPANGEGNCIRVLVRYPKAGGDVLTNQIEETLKGVDSQEPHVSSASASMNWKDYEFTYDGEPTSMVKFTGDYEAQDKTINSMLALLQRGEDITLSWGMRATGNLYSGVNYNGTSYHGEMTDDRTYWTPLEDSTTPAKAQTLMTAEDYQYLSARVYVSTYHIDRSNGQKIFFDQNSPDAPDITVWAMTGASSDFQEVTSFKASELSYTNAPDALYKEVDFPVGAYRVKVTFGDTKDYMYLRIDPSIQLKASSPTLKTWFEEAAAAGKDMPALRVQNFNYYQMYSENNVLINQNGTGDYRFTSPYVDNDLLAVQDKAEYGKVLDRSSAGITVSNLTGSSQTMKYASKPANDTVEQAVHTDYWLHGRDWYDMTQDDYTELVAAGWTPPARDEAQFYDLLPLGMVYDGRQYPVVYDIEGRSNTSNLDVQLIDNFRGTGRQMVVFNITAKEAGGNISSDPEIWVPHPNPDGTVSLVRLGWQPPSQSGYTVKFRATVPWNKVLFTNGVDNLAAFQVPESYPLRGGGQPDNGIAPIVQDVKGDDGQPVFADLRGNGIDENIPDTKYMTLPTNIQVPIALGSGLTKQVRADDSLNAYIREAQTRPGGGYTYRMTMDTDSVSKMKNLVLFDILEEAENTEGATGETSWKGVVDQVDASDALLIGIEPHVYYSTTPNLSYGDLDGSSLDDATVWSTQEPADRATITAVAVDLRSAADGSEYVFQPSTGVSVLIHMKAPGDLPEQQYAFNRAAYYSTLLDPFGGEKTETNVGDRTTVSIADSPVFVKMADPAGGYTADNATTVQPGQEITYTLSFNPMKVNAKNIVVKDFVPAWLDLVPGSITFKPYGADTTQTIDDAAYDAAAGELTWPAYDQAASGAATFQFKATARPLENGEEYRLYENKASATMGDNPPTESNVITHQQLNRWADVSKTAALVEGVTPSDPDAAHGGTVQDENGGSAEAAVPTGLSQVVEYHLVVKNTGANQTSGEIDVKDTVPAGTTYLPGSATVTFRSGDNPENPLPGSVATATVQEPTDGNHVVSWKLSRMSDGEEAYLTFRVSAPETAFADDQVGMWSELGFENTAQMIDVLKHQTKTTETTYHKVQEARITATKQWNDRDDQEGIRPQSVSVQLYADGLASGEPVALNEANGWMHAWKGLAASKADTGERVVSTVKETQAAPGYQDPEYAIDAKDESLVTIVNTHVPETPQPPKPPTPTPTNSTSSVGHAASTKSAAATGDPLFLTLLGIAGVGVLASTGVAVYALRKKRRG